MSTVTGLGNNHLLQRFLDQPLDKRQWDLLNSPMSKPMQRLLDLPLNKYRRDLLNSPMGKLPQEIRYPTLCKLPQLQGDLRNLEAIKPPGMPTLSQAAMQLLSVRLNPAPVRLSESFLLPPMMPGVYGGRRATEIGRRKEYFQDREIILPNIDRLPVGPQLFATIKARLKEAHADFCAGSYLSAIIMWGSVMEAALLGAAENQPATFNRASASPKDANGKPKRFRDWSLAELINVAHEVHLIGLDVQKFAHVLRDFRNYIHPHQQIAEGFTPDEHTAKICLQVLTATLAGIAGER